MLSALKPDADSRGWLEERLLNDRSPDVQGGRARRALVVQGALHGRRRIREEPPRAGEGIDGRSGDARALVERGERMVDEYDPRRVELELRSNADFYRDVAIYTSGAARQAMQRHSEYYRRIGGGVDGADAAIAAMRRFVPWLTGELRTRRSPPADRPRLGGGAALRPQVQLWTPAGWSRWRSA